MTASNMNNNTVASISPPMSAQQVPSAVKEVNWAQEAAKANAAGGPPGLWRSGSSTGSQRQHLVNTAQADLKPLVGMPATPASINSPETPYAMSATSATSRRPSGLGLVNTSTAGTGNQQQASTWQNLNSPWSATAPANDTNGSAFNWDTVSAQGQGIPRPRSGSEAAHLPGFLAPEEFQSSRQTRSMSFSVGTTLAEMGFRSSRLEEEDALLKNFEAFKLSGNNGNAMDSQASGDADLYSKARLRSKSSSAVYALATNNEEDEEAYDSVPGFPTMMGGHRSSNASAADIWNNGPVPGTDSGRMMHSQQQQQQTQPLYHRRASTQPSSSLMWESKSGPRFGTLHDPVLENGEVMMNSEQLERYRQQRRFSHAPTIHKEYTQRMMINRYVHFARALN
jgi:hypothetical protein